MLKIKLQRVGRKHDPSYRVVVTDRRTGPKSNKHIAIVGNYDTIRKTVNLEVEEIKEWIAKGAKPTETVHNILVKEGVIKGEKINVLSKKSPIIDEEAIKKAEEEKLAKEEAAKKAKEEAKVKVEAESQPEEKEEVIETEEAEKVEEVSEAVVETEEKKD